MTQSETERRARFKIVPRLLDHIDLAMYSSVPKAISELVANSYDANAREVRIDLTGAGKLRSNRDFLISEIEVIVTKY